MCKCNPGAETHGVKYKESKFPYCYEGNCRPSDEWQSLQKNCPWHRREELYGPGKNDLCLATGINASMFGHSWSSGDFTDYWCSEENCGVYHFTKESK